MGFQDSTQNLVTANLVSANPDGGALTKENDFENADGGDGICWISKTNPLPTTKKEFVKENTIIFDDEVKIHNELEKSPMVPKKLFSETDAPEVTLAADVDAQVIRKQDKTFEELLESQLKNGLATTTNSQNGAAGGKFSDDVPADENLTPELDPELVTPHKGEEPQEKVKKAFLRRGSNSKYDPTQAIKQTHSQKKFKYYTDNFKNKKEEGQETA